MEKKTFDITNCIIIGGAVHALTTKKVACPYYPSHNPCEMCSLRECCDYSFKELCDVLGASNEEFFQYVGYVVGISAEKCKVLPIDKWEIEYSSTVDVEGKKT